MAPNEPAAREFTVVSIDPSMWAAGVAVLSPVCGVVVDAIAVTFDMAYKDMPWPTRAMLMAEAIVEQIRDRAGSGTGCGYPLVIATEIPSNWFCATGTAAKDSESIQKLYMMVGMQLSLLWSSGIPYTYLLAVPPSVWKGQVPKSITAKRCAAYLGHQGHTEPIKDNNVTDAIMIGKWIREHGVDYDPRIPSLRFPDGVAVIDHRPHTLTASQLGERVGELCRLQSQAHTSTRPYIG